MRKLLLVLALAVMSGGCATSPVYNPLAAAKDQIFLLNESSFAAIKAGMKQSQVHQIKGDGIVIGYSYQKPLSDESSVSKASSGDYKPLTIPNPYKTEELKLKKGLYTIEYYASSVKQSDGIVNDDELIPLIFRDGILLDQGWERLKALRLKNPS